MPSSSSACLPNVMLVAVGTFLGLAISKALDLRLNPPPAPASVAPSPPPSPVRTAPRGFLEDVRFAGSLGPSGWKAAATWAGPHGSSLKVGSTINLEGVQEIEAALGYKAHEVSWVPDAELRGAVEPGKPGMKYAAKFTKQIEEGPEPAIVAEVSNSGASLGATLQQPLTDSADVAVSVRLPYEFESGDVDPTVSAETTYRVKNGKIVASLEAKASEGLPGTALKASYDLGA